MRKTEVTQAEEAAVMTTMTPISKAAEAEESHSVELTADVSVELPCLAIQIYSPTITSLATFEELAVEDSAGISLAVEAQTGAEDHTEAAEPPALDIVAPVLEVRAEVSVVQEVAARRPEEPEVLKDKSTSGSYFVAKEMVGDLGTIITEAAQAYAKLEASSALVEIELVEAKEKIISLEGTLKFQQVQYKLLRDRNLQLEEVLKTSVRAADIVLALKDKYWDDINLCYQVMRLLSPQFPTVAFDPGNASATCADDLYVLRGRNWPPSPSMPGQSSCSETPRKPKSLEQAERPSTGWQQQQGTPPQPGPSDG